MNKVEYKKSQKKQLQIIGFGILIIFLVIVALMYKPITVERTILALVIIASMGFILIFAIRKNAKEVHCPHCHRDLFEIIEVPKNEKSDFKFCPFCGKDIEV